jgi:hypothetical protein
MSRNHDRLLKQIDFIPIYDNHSHATFPDDSDMDAMASRLRSTVLRLRDTNPEFVAAQNRSSAIMTISRPRMPSG